MFFIDHRHNFKSDPIAVEEGFSFRQGLVGEANSPKLSLVSFAWEWTMPLKIKTRIFMRKKTRKVSKMQAGGKLGLASLPMVSYNVHNLPNTLYMHQRQHSHQLQLFSSSTMILTSLVLHHVHHLVILVGHVATLVSHLATLVDQQTPRHWECKSESVTNLPTRRSRC